MYQRDSVQQEFYIFSTTKMLLAKMGQNWAEIQQFIWNLDLCLIWNVLFFLSIGESLSMNCIYYWE